MNSFRKLLFLKINIVSFKFIKAEFGLKLMLNQISRKPPYKTPYKKFKRR